jgi:Zn finger protein HypA/HybF involved in hydrogenase expression
MTEETFTDWLERTRKRLESIMPQMTPSPSPFYCLACNRDSIADWNVEEERYLCPHCEREKAFVAVRDIRCCGEAIRPKHGVWKCPKCGVNYGKVSDPIDGVHRPLS